MGTTLANIHVYKQDADTIKNLLPEEYVVKEISEDWVTILNKSLMEKDPDKVARKLSKSIASPLLCFLYLDDDLMALTMFKQGKRVASYAMNYGCVPYLKNCKAFVNELEYDPKSWTRLRKIFKCDDLGKKLDMLEEFFGVALYIDADFLDDGIEKFICHREDSIYKDYEKKQKKLNRIKNRFKVTLTQEVDGRLVKSDPVVINLLDNDGKYNIRGQVYKKFNNELIPIKDFRLPLRTFDKVFLVGNDIIVNRFLDNRCERYKDDGTLAKTIITPNVFALEVVLDNGDIICLTDLDTPRNSNFARYDNLVKYSDNGEMIWRFNEKAYTPRLIGDHIYLSTGDSYKDKKIVKLDLDGKIIFTKSIPFIDERQCYLINGYIYATYRKYINSLKGSQYYFIRMNEDFECLDTIELDESLSVLFYANVRDTIRNKVYCTSLDNSVVAFDLDTMQYSSKKFDTEISLSYIDKEGYIYGIMGGGGSTVCVLDTKLDIVSRHRVKGDVCNFYENVTGVHILTSTGNTMPLGFEQEQCMVRVYSLDRL